MKHSRVFLAIFGAAACAALIPAARPGEVRAQPPAVKDGRDDDRRAIIASSKAFADAFSKQDAKALASQFTVNGELDDHGSILRGREAIEKAYVTLFKDKPDGRVEVLVDSVRFPSADCAIEEGLIRRIGDGRELPGTTAYSAFHVREKDGWKIAAAREWGAGRDRLEDLDWLLGSWTAAAKGRDFTLTFKREEGKPFLQGTFVSKADGKTVASGTIRVGLDRQRPQINSWQFDDDGGHARSRWVRDGNRWVLDTVGVTADGADTACVNVIGRINGNELTWRTIDRVVAGQKVPDTVPLKLTKAK